MKSFEAELSELINKHGLENESDTPDYILAKFLVRVLNTFNQSVSHRTWWYRPAEEMDEECPEKE